MATDRNGPPADVLPPWTALSLHELTPHQWEALCDGCGKCCLAKLEDEDTGEIWLTSVACDWLDPERVRCSDYENRAVNEPNCLVLSAELLPAIWKALPDTCAYRLRYLGKPLPDWHPLRTGGRRAMARAGHSIRHRCINGEAAERSIALAEDTEAGWQALIIPEWSDANVPDADLLDAEAAPVTDSGRR